jgi:hypothetical protein
MKTDLGVHTKYYLEKYDGNDFVLELQNLINENWWYAQLDSSIRFAFAKYNFPLPETVIVEKLSHYVIINIVRPNIYNIKDASIWKRKWLFVIDELNLQAKANSTTDEDSVDYIKYEFKLI